MDPILAGLGGTILGGLIGAFVTISIYRKRNVLEIAKLRYPRLQKLVAFSIKVQEVFAGQRPIDLLGLNKLHEDVRNEDITDFSNAADELITAMGAALGDALAGKVHRDNWWQLEKEVREVTASVEAERDRVWKQIRNAGGIKA
jgi:hypothetical protein